MARKSSRGGGNTEVISYEFVASNWQVLDAVSQVERAFKDLDKVKNTQKKFDDFGKTLNKASNWTKNLAGQFQKLSNQFRSVRTESSLLGKAMSALVGVQLGKWLADSTKSAIDFTETVNLFNVAMKDSREAAYGFVDSVAEMYGLDPKWLMDATGLFYEMAYAVEMPDKAARSFATSLTALSVDLASLFNVDVDKVSQDLTSGMRGQSRAVLKYGMDLRATTVEQTALTLGLEQNYETMNEASRELLRYITAVRQARDATGDFAKTIESPANQLRILKEQVAQLGRALGNILLNYISPWLPVLNGIVMAITAVISAFSALAGIKYTPPDFSANMGGAGFDTDKVSSGVEGIGDAADKTKKKLQGLVAPFDELNILQESQADDAAGGAGGGGVGAGSWGEVDPRLLAELEAMQYTLDEVRLKAIDTRDAILDFFGLTPHGDSWVYEPLKFEQNLKNLLPGWTKSIEELFDLDFKAVSFQIGQIFRTLKEIAGLTFDALAEDFTAIFGVTPDEALATFIRDLPQNLQGINEWLQANKETIADVAAKVIEFYLAWKVFAAVAPIVAAAFSALSTGATLISGLLGGLSLVVSPIGNKFTDLSKAIFNFGTSLTAPPVAAFSGQLSVGASTTTTLTGKIGALAMQLSGPLAAAVIAIQLLGAALFIGSFIQWATQSDVFKEQLSIMFQTLGDIITHFGELFTAVKDAFIAGISFMATHFEGVYEAIVAIINNLLAAFDGIIVFLTGVFSGDWKKAFKGLVQFVVNIFFAGVNALIGVFNGLISMIEAGLNALINMFLAVVRPIIKAINNLMSLLGFGGRIEVPADVNIQLPTFETVKPPEIMLAKGGVITGPTRAWIGEGQYDEAVIPLGDSPQMAELLDKFADVAQQSGNPNVEVRVFIGGREWDADIYKAAQRGEKIVGKSPVKEEQ